MYITRRKLSELRQAAGLTEADELLVRHVPALLAALLAAPYNDQLEESDGPTVALLAANLGLTVSDLYKVLELARAAGRLVKVS